MRPMHARYPAAPRPDSSRSLQMNRNDYTLQAPPSLFAQQYAKTAQEMRAMH